MNIRQTRNLWVTGLMLVGCLLLLTAMTVGCGVSQPGDENNTGSTKEVSTQDGGDLADTTQNSETTPESGSADSNPDNTTADSGKVTCRNDCDCPQVCTGGFCSNEKRAPRCPLCTDSSCDVGKPCSNGDGTLGICQAPPPPCKDDCDCYAQSRVCDQGKCSTIQRASRCKSCDNGQCKTGERCYQSDKTIGTCPPITNCKHDCDCFAQGEVCEAGTCQKLRRPSTCELCVVGQCKAGDPCRQQDGSIGTCPKPTTCKHDCDCRKESKVCASDNTCQALRRLSNCVSCTDTQCKEGDPCFNKDDSIGRCPKAATPCKHDCDCRKEGKVCATDNTCQPLKRASLCLSCDGGSCKTGEPCFNKDDTIGTCQMNGMGAPCKHDCDCQKYGLLCNSGKCAALRRISYCLSCTNPNCKAGDPCLDSNGSIGTCPSSSSCKDDCDCPSSLACLGGACQAAGRMNACPSCTSQNCPTNNRCRNQDGTLGTCCCRTSGCGTGKLCCSGGAPPPPGVCGSFCTSPDPKTGQCPLFP
ncbi:MAG: hypothetical protein EP343_30205 [Deltaproteobacteria bacterium]|nr:MAG: hypothetical protein EP343_30205 [Deltaproteobacteria bacterium]